MSSPAPFAYRPEIDGLRSIAVLAVVLYHFGVPGLQGGFVGVDIFFVISGFLIGGLLWREAQSSGTISLRRFYIRRIKRLAPAYVAMALASLIVGYLVLLPFEFREFGKSLIAATVYLSNVHFFREAGYFDTASEDKVLLHTWSLSVEEQFYIVLPLVMLVLLRRPLGLRGLLWACFALSLAGCIWITARAQPAAFYLFPFRAWELLAGVLLAIEGHKIRPNRLFSASGLALILGSIALIPAGAGFPGWLAVFPVLGTALLIAGGPQDSALNHALSSPLPVGIGLISYSLYLWHWPVLTLSRYYRGAYSGWVEVAFWLLVSAGLAYLSWRIVERPVRRKELGALPVFGGAALASGALIAAGGLLFVKDGLIDRFGPPLRTHIEASADFLQDWSRCTVPANGPYEGIEICPIGPDGPPKVLIWGDSHVRALKEGLEQLAFEKNTPALLIWRAGCAPVFGLIKDETSASPAQDAACTRANDQIEQALGSERFDHILLVGRWAYYISGGGTGRDAENRISLTVRGQGGAQQDQFVAGLNATIAQLNAEVFVLGAVPEIAGYDSRQIARALAGHRMNDAALAQAVTLPRASHAARIEGLDRINATVLDPSPYFCGAAQCSALHNGQAQYFDNNHIINAAARRIRALFAPVFELGGGA